MYKLEYMSVGDVVSITSGFAFKSDLFNDLGNGFPIIRIRDVVRGATKTYYSGNYDEKYIVKAGDYLIGMDGEFNIAKWESEDALLNQRVCKISMDIRKADERYLYYVLKGELKNIEERTPFVTVKHLSAEDIRSTIVFLPPIETQRRIAAALDQAQALVDLRRQQIALLDELIKSVFLEMFGDPVTNPKGFPLVRGSGIVLSVKCGPFGSALKRDEYTVAGVPVWTMDNIKNDTFSEDGCLYIEETKFQALSNYNVREGDIIISRAGTVGKLCVVKTKAEKSIISTNLIRIRLNQQQILPQFYSFLIAKFGNRVGRLKTGDEGAYTFMNTQAINNIDIYLPPLDLQNQFAAIVEQLEEQKAVMEQSLTLMEENFNSIMQKAFRGELFS